jgi:sialate O-acetylesterase
MIKSWREAWKKDFPFYYVQIAPYKYGFNNVGALLREAQTKSLSLPGTGMVVITDLVDNLENIHPENKHDVGLRLANYALAETYKQKGIAYKSPMYKSKTTSGNKITLSFDNIPKGFKETDAIVGFSIFDTKTGQWYDAQAKIEKDKIIVWSDEAISPAQVRYAFGNTIIGNVFSKEGLPLCPFRTDNWEVDQSEIK